MRFFRHSNKRTRLLWSLLLLLSLLCGQGVTLHAHHLDHGHDEHLHHSHTPGEAGNHHHLSKIHSAYDLSHSEHHTAALYEAGTSPDAVLKNGPDISLLLALFFLPCVLAQNSALRQRLRRYRGDRPLFHEQHLLSPPLRAPPL